MFRGISAVNKLGREAGGLGDPEEAGVGGGFYCNSGLFSQSKQHTLGPMEAGIVITNTVDFLPSALYNRTGQTAARRRWRRAEARICPDGNNRNQRVLLQPCR